MKHFVPEDFTVPLRLETDHFILRPLSMDDVDKDYEAVMSSVAHLQKQIPESVFSHVWPDVGMTKREDQADLGWHEVEFKMRSSFTYTVMKPDESQCLGCVYIFPPRFTNSDAEVFLWVREREFKKGLDAELFSAVKDWMKAAWPFAKVVYPFRQNSGGPGGI